MPLEDALLTTAEQLDDSGAEGPTVDMESSRHIQAPPEVVWERLNDTRVLKESIAGCVSFRAESQHTFCATIKTRLGPVSVCFEGRLTLRNVVAGRSYTLAFDGQGGFAGFSRGSADVTLEPRDGGTHVRYVVNAEVGGGIAHIGQPVIDRVARRMADDFFARFEQVVTRLPAAGR